MLCRLSALLCALAHYKSHSEEECHYQLVVSRRNAYLSRRDKARLINDRTEDDLCRILHYTHAAEEGKTDYKRGKPDNDYADAHALVDVACYGCVKCARDRRKSIAYRKAENAA